MDKEKENEQEKQKIRSLLGGKVSKNSVIRAHS